MKLTLWTYEGPPHVGAMRVATAMEGLHYVLHAPQGDTYADLLFTMIERQSKRPPVTYTTFQARDLGGDTAELFKNAAREAYERFKPQALLVGASCTAELIQDDPGGLARALGLPVPVVAVELPAYQKKENWGAAETFYQLVRAFSGGRSAGSGQGRNSRSLPLSLREEAGARGPLSGGTTSEATLAPPPPPNPLPARGGGVCLLLAPRFFTPPRPSSPLQPAGPDRSGLPPSRRRHGNHRPARPPRHRRQRYRAARCHAGRSGATCRCRLQRRAVSGDRPAGGAMAATHLRPTADPHRADRHRRHPGLHRRGCRADGHRSGTVTGCRRLAAAVVLAFGRLHLSDRQARLHLRRCHPRHRRGPHCVRGTRLHRGRTWHLYARVCARGQGGRETPRPRSVDHRRLSGSGSRGRGGCIPSWCSGRKWNGISPSGWAFPAR